MIENKKSYLEKIHRTKPLLLLLKDFESRSHFLLFLGTGLYLLSISFLIQLFISLAISLPLITFYPLITSVLLKLLNIIALCCVFLGIITIIFPLIIQEIYENKTFSRILTIILIIIAVWTMLFVPIGFFLGMGVITELRTNKIREGENANRSEKKSNREWFLLLFIAGIIHVIFGGLMIFLFPFVFFEVVSLLFPYLNYELLTFLIIIGVISFISGSLLTFCSIWLKKFSRSKIINKRNRQTKIIYKIIFISSILMMFIFPIGTFFGLTIIQVLGLTPKKNDSNNKKKLKKTSNINAR